VDAVRIVLALPEPWLEIVASIIGGDERLEVVGLFATHDDPLAAAREADADFLIAMESAGDDLAEAGSRPAVVLVEEGGRNGRVLRFRPQSEPLHSLSARTLLASLAATPTT
jgi:hypothetical protein